MKQDDLFQLIKSLEKNEQIYFKRNIKKKEEANFLILFDAINNQKSNNETLLKQNLPPSIAKNLSRNKNYLYNLLLKSLKSYHADNLVELQIYNLINDYKLLIQKGLDNQALQRLQQVKKLIHNTNSYELELLLITLEETIKGNNVTSKEVEESIGKSNQLVDKIQTNLNISKVLLQLKEVAEAGYTIENAKEKVEQLEKNQVFKLKPKELDTKILIKFHTLKAIQARIHKDTPKAYKEIKAVKNAIDNNSNFKKLRKKQSFGVLSNCLLFSAQLGKTTESDQYLKEMEAVVNQPTKFSKSINTLYAKVLYYVNYTNRLCGDGEFKKAFEVVAFEIEPWLAKHESRMKFQGVGQLWFMLIIIAMFSHQHKETKKFIAKYEEFALIKKEYGLLYILKMFLMMIHFEDKEYKWIAVELQNTSQLSTSKKFEVSPLDKIMHSFFKRQQRVHLFDKSKEIKALKTKIVKAINDNPELKEHNEMFRYSYWCDYILNGTSFEESFTPS